MSKGGVVSRAWSWKRLGYEPDPDNWTDGELKPHWQTPRELVDYIRLRMGVQPRMDKDGNFSPAIIYAANKFATEWLREKYEGGPVNIVAVRDEAVKQAVIPTDSEIAVFDNVSRNIERLEKTVVKRLTPRGFWLAALFLPVVIVGLFVFLVEMGVVSP